MGFLRSVVKGLGMSGLYMFTANIRQHTEVNNYNHKYMGKHIAGAILQKYFPCINVNISTVNREVKCALMITYTNIVRLI